MHIPFYFFQNTKPAGAIPSPEREVVSASFSVD